MGWAAALQGGWAQRGLFDFRVGVVGVFRPVDVGVGVPVPDAGIVSAAFDRSDGSEGAGRLSAEAVMSPVVVGVEESDGVVPPRRGERRCKVVAGWRASSATVLEGSRWRPAWRRRTSEGRFMEEADRKSRTSEMVLQGRTLSGMAG